MKTRVTIFTFDGVQHHHDIADLPQTAEEEGRIMDAEVSKAVAAGLDVTGIKLTTVPY